MCGRFSRIATLQAIINEFEIEEVNGRIEPSYNIAPGHEVAVLLKDDSRKLGLLKWGLIPRWSKDPSIGNRMINARAETVAEKPSFRVPLRRKRCLIVADGFFEWKKDEKRKIPMYIFLKGQKPFVFAGLWDTWTSPEGKKFFTCTIITTEPNELMKKIHNRMPVIISKKHIDLWLDRTVTDEQAVLPLLRPFPAGEMDAYEVSRYVNSPANNSPQCIEKV